jgi:hypothetical protein
MAECLLGTKQTSLFAPHMSVIWGKADIFFSKQDASNGYALVAMRLQVVPTAATKSVVKWLWPTKSHS